MPRAPFGVTLARLAAGGVAFGALLVFAVGMFGSGQLQGQVVSHGLPCLFRSATGLVCPFCGMTHAIAALGAGDISAALAAHPLAPLLLLGTLWLGGSLALRGRMQIFGKAVEPAPLLAGVGVIWIVNLGGFLLF